MSRENYAIGKQLAERLSRLISISIPVLEDDRLDEDAWLRNDLILIGNLNDNRAVARLYFDFKAFLDAAFPGPGGFAVQTLENPLGHGRPVALVGGSDREGTLAAVEQFLSLVTAHGSLLPRLHHVRSRFLPQSPTPEQVDEMLEGNRLSLQTGMYRGSHLVSYGLYFHLTADTVWAHLFKESLTAYIEAAGVHGDWQFDPMIAVVFRYYPILDAWALIERDRFFSDADRELFRSAFLDIARYMANLSYANFLANLPGEPRQNHSTFLGLSLEAAARYFGRRGHDPEELSHWRSISSRIFEGQARTYRSDDDGWGYAWYSPLHAFDFFKRMGDDRVDENDFLHRLGDLAVIMTDNRRDQVTNGDVRTYVPWDQVPWPSAGTVLSRALWTRQDPQHRWVLDWVTEGKDIPLSSPAFHHHLGLQLYATEGRKEAPERFLGIAGIELDEAPLQWVASRVVNDSWQPRQGIRYPDKISLRSSFEAADEYMVIDGTAAFVHGHKDANSILRLTWHDRIWLVDLDYTRRQPRHHNSIDVSRNGQTGILPPLSELVVQAEWKDLGMLRMDLNDYGGVDWRRNLVWDKGNYFVVIDELKAKVEGDYDLRCYWRMLGDAAENAGHVELSQPGAYFRIVHADGAERWLEVEDRNLEAKTQRGDWSRYPYSDGAVQVLTQRKRARLSPGESKYFMNLLYARPEGQASDLKLKQVDSGVALVEGDGEASVIGVGPETRKIGSLEIDARIFRLGEGAMRVSGLTGLRWRRGWFRTDRPVDLVIDPGGEGRIETSEATSIRGAGHWQIPGEHLDNATIRSVDLPPGVRTFQMEPWWSRDEFERILAGAREPFPQESRERIEFGLTEKWHEKVGAGVTVLQQTRDGWIVGTRDGGVWQVTERGASRQVAKLEDEIRAVLDLGREGVATGDRTGRVIAWRDGWQKAWERTFDQFWGYRERVAALALQEIGSEKRILVGTESPRVHALSLQGEKLWSTPASGAEAGETKGRRVEWWGAITELKTGDISQDGKDEIVLGLEYKTPIVILDQEGLLQLLTWAWEGSESRSRTPFVGINAKGIHVVQLEEYGNTLVVYGTETDEVYALKGDGRPHWVTNVGGEVNGLAVQDLDGDGKLEIVVVTAMGSLVLLDHQGRRKWWREHDTALTALSVGTMEVNGEVVIVVGSRDGWVFGYDLEGNPLAATRETTGGAIKQLDLSVKGWGEVVAATESGTITCWQFRPRRPFSRSSRHHY